MRKFALTLLLLPLLAGADQLVINEASYDAYIYDSAIRSDNPTTNYRLQAYFYVSTGYKGLIGVDPAGAGLSGVDVASCTLSVFNTYYEGGETHLASEVLRTVVVNQVTWNVYSTGNSWTTAGCAGVGTDYDGTPFSSVTKTSSGIYYHFPLDQAWMDSLIVNSEVGWILIWKNASGDNSYYQTEEGANPPYLTINYTAAAPPDAPTIVNPLDGSIGIIPNLVHHAVTVTADSVQYQIDTNSGLTSVDVDSVIDGTILSKAMSASQTYYWAARGKNGGGWGAWSDTVSYVTGATISTGGYWVDKWVGDDANDGGFAHPWLTVVKACTTTAAQMGDTVHVRGGDYASNGAYNPANKACDGTDFFYFMGAGSETVYTEKLTLDENDNGFWIENIAIDSTDGIAIAIAGTDSVMIKNCRLFFNDHSGVEINPNIGLTDTICSYITIRDSDLNENGQFMDGNSGCGVCIYAAVTHYLAIANCTINLNNEKGIAYARSGYLDCDYGKIDSCTIINNLESGIDIQGWEFGRVGWNYVAYNGQRDTEADEWGDKGVQLWSDAATTVTANDTIIFNVFKSSGRYEMQPTDGPLFIYNNLFKVDSLYSAVGGEPANIPRAALILFENSTAIGSEFKNNIIMSSLADSNKSFLWEISDWNDWDANTWDYNCYFGQDNGAGSPYNRLYKVYNNSPTGGAYLLLDSLQAHSHEVNSFEADPLFTSEPDSNFVLQAGSPCINAGVDVGYPYQGAAPDIGPYEYTEGGESGGGGGNMIIIIQ